MYQSEVAKLSIEENTKVENREAGSDAQINNDTDTYELQVGRGTINSAEVMSGKSYWISVWQNKTLSNNTLKQASELISKKMESLGFTKAASKRKAHVNIGLYSGRRESPVVSYVDKILRLEKAFATLAGETQNNYEAEMLEHNESMIAFFYIQFDSNRYGKRPKTVSWLAIYSPAEEWTGFEDKIKDVVSDNFEYLMNDAPANNEAMKGDPACIPRFGYETDDSNIKIISILPNSPAEKAGLKVGDELIAIDSSPAAERVKDKIYEELLSVPVKYKRNGKIKRTSFRPQIMCE
tara:strand:- start:103 stop:984 length:882 start_codon:yes stop_codon:yes gene_type:complete